MQALRIATRKSPLALWQAEYVRNLVTDYYPGTTVEIIGMSTEGDRQLDTRLASVGGKGLFMKELEQALLSDAADIAVHSMKDVTVDLPAGLEIATICEREEPADAMVSRKYSSLASLPPGGRVGTSSLRRKCQLAHAFPELEILDLRGNVNTRLARLDAGDFDAIILAAAGLIRLGMEDRITETINLDLCLPAVGQGAVGIECRSDDAETIRTLAALGHEDTAVCVAAERSLNRALGGGCHVPIAGYAVREGESLWLRGRVGDPGGERLLQAEARSSLADTESLGERVANDLLKMGAGEILEGVYRTVRGG